jgi:hypothetical protein
MRHPALRRSARHTSKREAKSGIGTAAPPQSNDPSAQSPAKPGVPADGNHNQGGSRPEGLEYQRDLGSEQDA